MEIRCTFEAWGGQGYLLIAYTARRHDHVTTNRRNVCLTKPGAKLSKSYNTVPDRTSTSSAAAAIPPPPSPAAGSTAPSIAATPQPYKILSTVCSCLLLSARTSTTLKQEARWKFTAFSRKIALLITTGKHGKHAGGQQDGSRKTKKNRT